MIRSGVWIATAAVLLACILFVRLLYAPIDVGVARTLVLSQTRELLPGWDVSFEEAEVGWDWRSVRPWVSISNFRLIDRRDRLTAFIPEARVGVSFTGMFTDISFSTVEVDHAQILVADLSGFSDATAPGSSQSLFGSSGIPKPDVMRPIAEAFSRFGARLLRIAPKLDDIILHNAAVGLVRGEGLDNAAFSLPRFTLHRDQKKLVLDAMVDASLVDVPTQIRMRGQAEPGIGAIDLNLAFSELRPSALAQVANLPEFVSYFNLPIALDLQLELSAVQGLEMARFTATLDEGTLSHPVAYPENSKIRYGLISGRFEASEDTIVIDNIELVTPQRTIKGDGTVFWVAGFDAPAVQLSARVDTVTIPEILDYWPIKVYPDGRQRGARAWISDHMLAGTTQNVRFNVDWHPGDGGAFDKGSAYKLTFDFDQLDTHFLLTMPPILGASGHGVLTNDVFDIDLDGGAVSGMPMAGTTIHMQDINVRNGATGTFDVRLQGDVPTILALIEHEPLRVPQKLGFDVARIGGDARVRAVVSLPLIRDLPADAVLYDVSADLTQTTVKDLLGGEGLTEGDLRLTVDSDHVAAEGTGLINGVPLALYWREDLKLGRENPDANTREIILSGTVDEKDMQALGVDVSSFLEGKVLAEANFHGRNFAFRHGSFSADTSGAILKNDDIVWRKAPSVPATVNGTVYFDEGQTRLDPIIIAGEEIDAKATLTWQTGGQFDGIIAVSKLGDNSFTATISQPDAANIRLDIAGDQLNLGPLLQADQLGKTTDPKKKLRNLDLTLSAGKLLMLNGEALDNVALSGHFSDGSPDQLKFTGNVHGTEKQVSLEISGARDADLHTLNVSTPDGGHFLRGLGLFAHLRDGAMTLDGTTSGWGGDLHIAGKMSMKNAYMVSEAKLGSAVNVGVIEGLNTYLKDNAVELSEIEIPFDYSQGMLDLTSMKANGPSLGMTMEGQISARAGKINVNGVFVPAYGLNALLGKIPILGALLTGGDGKGVFGVAYRVKGSTENPEFNINPLSGLAPGFLRLLFEGRKGKVDVDAPVAPEAETKPEDAPQADGQNEPAEPAPEGVGESS